MQLQQIKETKLRKFVGFHLTIIKKDNTIMISDEITRDELKSMQGIEEGSIDSFAINYQEYLTYTVIPQQLSRKEDIQVMIDGRVLKVQVEDVADMNVIFNYED